MKFRSKDDEKTYYGQCLEKCGAYNGGKKPEPKVDCNSKCEKVISIMKFKDKGDEKTYWGQCLKKCDQENQQDNTKPCPERLVDCSRKGGYDPKDPCK